MLTGLQPGTRSCLGSIRRGQAVLQVAAPVHLRFICPKSDWICGSFSYLLGSCISGECLNQGGGAAQEALHLAHS
jgi:hypothetical protein